MIFFTDFMNCQQHFQHDFLCTGNSYIFTVHIYENSPAIYGMIFFLKIQM